MKYSYEVSLDKTTDDDLRLCAAEHGLLDINTLKHWGVAKSIDSVEPNHTWLIPCKSVDGSIEAIYIYRNKQLIASSRHSSGLFYAFYDRHKSTNYWCHGPFNGMSLYETVGKFEDDINILAYPSVSELSSLFYLGEHNSWAKLVEGKKNILTHQVDLCAVDSVVFDLIHLNR